jgi:PadR family transcriptional regulator PadR
MRLEKDLVAASTIPLLLSILTEGENYGYAIIQRVHELSGGNLQWTDGMLYPVLRWLEDRDCIRSEWREGQGGPRRKYYRLEAKGRALLVQQQDQWKAVNKTLTRAWKLHHA